MALQVLVGEFVGYSVLFLRTIEGKPTCPKYHKLDPYKSCLLLPDLFNCFPGFWARWARCSVRHSEKDECELIKIFTCRVVIL